MKKIVTLSLIAAMAMTGANAASNAQLASQMNSLETQLADLKEQLDKQNTKINKVKAHDANDNIKWGVDLRTSIDSINYKMADGRSPSNDSLMGMRLWLNMAYAVDSHNIFKGRLAMNKAFGADFGTVGGGMDSMRAFGMGSLFDWTGNSALSDNNLRVSQAYWLYLGDDLFGADIPWTFSLGRRPSTAGFLANLREDDAASSPLAHVINVEFDGLSSKIDLSNVTGVPGMSFKVCMGRGASAATPLFDDSTSYSDNKSLDNIDLAGFIFEPYNDGQYIVKATWYRAWNLPGMAMDMTTGESLGFRKYGDMDGAALSVLVDGLTEDDGILSETKVFGSFAWTQTSPDAFKQMLGKSDSKSGTSYWIGTQIPVIEDGVLGIEFNHGSKYWRPFTYAEDTMIGSKIAARGDAWEAYFNYDLTEALSAQIRYTGINYDYTGSQGFFGNTSGASMKITDVKEGAASWAALGGTRDPASGQTVVGNLMGQGMSQDAAMMAANDMGMAAAFLPSVVDKAQDFRFYLRYRF